MNKVSIITATYKRYDVLSRSVDSSLSQTYDNIEVIVVDDNPPESDARKETAAVMEKYAGDNRVKYIQNEKNVGGAVTRNNGIKIATGDYITFLDDDDEYLPEKVETELSAMLENGYDACVMDGATYDEEDNFISEKKQHLKNGMNKDELMRVHMMYHISGTNTFMFKAEKLREIGGFDDLPACQEYVLMQKAVEAGMKIGYVEKTLVKNHIGKGERLSTSLKKIPAQNLLIEKKKKYFSLLTKKERRAVMCRHYGVLFNIYYKNKKIPQALSSLIKCGVSSPVDAFRWYKEYKNKLGA